MTFAEVHPYLATICLKYRLRYPALEVDELVDEMWLRCDFSKFTAFQGQGLSRYITYRILEYLRRRLGSPINKRYPLRHPTVNLDDIHDIAAPRNGLDTVDDDDAFEWLISSLDARSRFILTMRYRYGATQEKIAEQIGRSETHVSLRLRAALGRLRRRLSA